MSQSRPRILQCEGKAVSVGGKFVRVVGQTQATDQGNFGEGRGKGGRGVGAGKEGARIVTTAGIEGVQGVGGREKGGGDGGRRCY